MMKLLVAIAVLITPLVALALMPPHVTGANVTDGGVLKSGTLVIHGYSLQYAAPDTKLEIVDVESNKPVLFSANLECHGEGDCDGNAPPGACQSRCQVDVTFTDVAAGTRLSAKYLEWHAVFRLDVAPEPQTAGEVPPMPDGPKPEPSASPAPTTSSTPESSPGVVRDSGGCGACATTGRSDTPRSLVLLMFAFGLLLPVRRLAAVARSPHRG